MKHEEGCINGGILLCCFVHFCINIQNKFSVASFCVHVQHICPQTTVFYSWSVISRMLPRSLCWYVCITIFTVSSLRVMGYWKANVNTNLPILRTSYYIAKLISDALVCVLRTQFAFTFFGPENSLYYTANLLKCYFSCAAC